ncbi:transcriptional regulator [Lysinibacillus sp. FSL K6-3209]|uniref:transcriptional regulator n=1 Tax=Lysinibacillus sp. FSL K6-3209 TaxID=2921497 RepID=UPI0030DD1084
MTSLSRSEVQTIEKYWIDYEVYKKKLKFREWELLHPQNEQGEMVGGRSNTISDTTAKKATVLANDAYYQNLKRIIKTVEDLYRDLDEDMRTIVDMRYWDKDGCYEWEDIADRLYISRHKVLRKRNILIDKTAERIGWV